VQTSVFALDEDARTAPEGTIGIADVPLRARRSLQDGAVLVLRPDGVVAWSGALDRSDHAIRFVAASHEPAPASAAGTALG
jgi:hypothetical protein